MDDNNIYIFVRHAETKKDPSKPPVEWDLTDDALLNIKKHIKNGVFDDAQSIYTSTEPKAILTGQPIAETLNLTSEAYAEFNEVRRSSAFLSNEDFLQEKKHQLTEWEYKTHDSESANEALSRFKEGLERISKSTRNEKIIIVSHGTVLSIYFSSIAQDDAFTRWEKMPFCGVGIVQNQKIIKDFS